MLRPFSTQKLFRVSDSRRASRLESDGYYIDLAQAGLVTTLPGLAVCYASTNRILALIGVGLLIPTSLLMYAFMLHRDPRKYNIGRGGNRPDNDSFISYNEYERSTGP